MRFAAAGQPAPDAPPGPQRPLVQPTELDQYMPDGKTEEEGLNPRWEPDPEHKWLYGNHPLATPEQMASLKRMLVEEKQAFAYTLSDMPGYCGDLSPASIKLTTDKPIWSPPRNYSPAEQEFGDKYVADLLEAGIVREVPTDNRYASAVTLPAKKGPDGRFTDKRFAVDLRRINQHSVTDRYRMPLPEELFRRMSGAAFMTKIDCRAGFFNIPLDEQTQPYTAFWWGRKLFAFTRVPFGHVNSTAIFQRIMDYELQAAGLTHCAVVFVDDLCVYSHTMDQHLQDVRAALQMFRRNGLRAHPGKTLLASDTIPYLGHMVSADSVRPEQAKVAAMQQLPTPTNQDMVRRVLGVLGFYRCYIPDYSIIAAPLNALLRKTVPFQWGPEHDQAFQQLKQALITPGLALRHPRPDLSFHLYTDWSQHGIAAVLNQRDAQGQEFMVACVSRSLNEHERRYEAWKGEMLAAVWGVKSMRPYLHGVHFHLHTDHRPLLWLLNSKEPTGQQARWILALQDYSFSLVHKPGAKNLADLPSRHPMPTAVDTTGARLDETGAPLVHSLPQVLFPDGTPDPTDYTFELLTQRKQQEQQPAAHPACAVLIEALPAAACTASQLDWQLCQCACGLQETSIDRFAPDVEQMLAGNNGTFTDPVDVAPDTSQAAQAWRQDKLDSAAGVWVQRARPVLDQMGPDTSLPGQHTGEPDEFGVRHTVQLSTAPVADSFFPAAAAGVVLLEPFGGLCAGLEMALRSGTAVSQYLYADTSPAARAIAAHRIQHLSNLYPTLLPPSAVQGAFRLSQDIRQITTAQLAQLTHELGPHPWLVVAGWPCQDLSFAGKAAGLSGERSSLIFELVRLIGALQQLQHQQPPAYVIENVAMQFHPDAAISGSAYERVCAMIGTPTLLDAAQFGSLAHRTRNWWTNLCSPNQLCAAAAQVVRPPGRTVMLALGPGRTPAAVKAPDRQPHHPVNEPGQPRRAWPTLMAHPYSHAFRAGEPGSVITASGLSDQPTATEREFALGYARDSTAAPGITEQQRREALGQCMDSNCVQCLFTIARAWWVASQPQHGAGAVLLQPPSVSDVHDLTAGAVPLRPPTVHAPFVNASGAEPSRSPSMPACCAGSDGAEPAVPPTVPPFSVACAVLHAAAAQDKLLSTDSAARDIWLDSAALHWLQQGTPPAEADAAERSRLTKRLQYYSWQDGRVMRTMPDGSVKRVPPPQERLDLIISFHDRCGHWGVRRTAALVQEQFWWHGLQADVASVVASCKECSRVKATFGLAKPAELQPLPICGLFYRWGVDLCGPFPVTPRGNKYIMVCIEHFSKQIVAVPIPAKTPECTSYVFAHHVLGMYGACAEVVHDNGTEWQDCFAQLLQDCLIDARHTSANHPAANGAAEKAVHIVKLALKKMCLRKQHLSDWDLELPWLLLGYRCSPQQSTGLTPYELLHAHSPVVPPAITERMTETLDLDDPAKAAESLQQRKVLVKRLCPEAMENLAIAQHRDRLRYAKIRSGKHVPRVHKFEVGDLVYMAEANQYSSLQPQAKPFIYRVKEVRDTGVLILQGRCGRTLSRHVTQCAPCHLPGVDTTLHPELQAESQEASCEQCGSLASTQENPMLLCDACDAGWHIQCLPTPLSEVPVGNWACPRCVQAGVTAGQLQQLVLQREQQERTDNVPNLFPTKQQRERDAAAQQLHGRLVKQHFVDRSTGIRRPFWGRVHFVSATRRPQYFDVKFEDGDVYQYTLAEVKKHLQPVNAVLPAGVTIPGD